MSSTISNLSSEVVIKADADVTIPSDLCDEVGRRVTVRAGAQLTLTAATGTINGDASFVLYAEESLQLIFDGANWIAL